MSLIREDDIEVYLRGVTYRNKINRVVNKLMSRLKWLPMQKRYDIFEEAVTKHQSIKKNNIKKQILLQDKIKASSESYIKTPD